MGIRAPNLQNQDHKEIPNFASFQESTYLKCKLKVLPPEQTLEECGIQQHATIRLMWQRGLRGGGACMSTPSVRVGPAVTADMRGGAAETGAAVLEAPSAAETGAAVLEAPSAAETGAAETGSAAVSADTAGTAAQTEGLRVAAVALAAEVSGVRSSAEQSKTESQEYISHLETELQETKASVMEAAEELKAREEQADRLEAMLREKEEYISHLETEGQESKTSVMEAAEELKARDERTPARQDERVPVYPDGPARARRVDGLGVKGVDTSR